MSNFAEPSESYESLKKQYNSLRMLASSQEKRISYLSKKDYQEARRLALEGAQEINALRETNEKLTDLILSLEQEIDRIKNK